MLNRSRLAGQFQPIHTGRLPEAKFAFSCLKLVFPDENAGGSVIRLIPIVPIAGFWAVIGKKQLPFRLVGRFQMLSP